MIPFNKPYMSGKETDYINEAVQSGKISGNGAFTQKCHSFFENTFGFKKVLLTTSCTDALEMCALLLDIQPGDEVIIPSYTFVSTALAFVRQGAKIIFVDSQKEHPNMDVELIEPLITPKTKVIVAVHYAGVACDMDKIMQLAHQHGVFVVEDAAQAIDSYYIDKHGKHKPLGGIGHLGAFSFHETKNIISGEGGMLVINDDRFIKRSEIIWEKGTNRAEFFRGEVNKYGWVDTGSSFLPSEIIAAFLWAQIENLDLIQNKRKAIWQQYYQSLQTLEYAGKINLPKIPSYSDNNAHMFYIVCKTAQERTELIQFLKEKGIHAVFHYLSLHQSEYYTQSNESPILPNSDFYTDRLLRLPLYYELTPSEQLNVTSQIISFYN